MQNLDTIQAVLAFLMLAIFWRLVTDIWKARKAHRELHRSGPLREPAKYYTALGGFGGGPIVRAPNPDHAKWLKAQPKASTKHRKRKPKRPRTVRDWALMEARGQLTHQERLDLERTARDTEAIAKLGR